MLASARSDRRFPVERRSRGQQSFHNIYCIAGPHGRAKRPWIARRVPAIPAPRQARRSNLIPRYGAPHRPVIGVKHTAGNVSLRLTPQIKTHGENLMILKKIALGMLAGVALGATANAADIDHVLLISVDGLHALDVANFVDAHPNSALAELSRHGVTYSNARTPANSDSFPGLLALVTGGSPITHGLFYDVSYDRTIFDPTNTACSGPPGNNMVFDESIDLYNAANVSQNVIDPSKLPRRLDPRGRRGPVYPHDAIRTNTIFEVVKAAGGVTAWADKHPAYDLVNGPSGKGVDDLYTPEVTNVNGFDNTVSVVCTFRNDFL